MKWHTASLATKATLVALVVIEVILAILLLVVICAGVHAYQVEACWFFHVVELICFGFIAYYLGRREEPDPHWEASNQRPPPVGHKPLDILVSGVFICTCVEVAVFSFYLAVAPNRNPFPAPAAMVHAPYPVLVLTILAWILSFVILLKVWLTDPSKSSARSKKPSSFTLFGKKAQVDWLKRPLPVRIIDVKKNPDPRVFEHHRPHHAGRRERERARKTHHHVFDHEKRMLEREPAWNMIPLAESGLPARPLTTVTDPFSDRFEVISLR